MKTGGGGGEGGENSSAEKLGDQNWANVQVPNFLSTVCFYISLVPLFVIPIIFQPPYSGVKGLVTSEELVWPAVSPHLRLG